MSIESIVNHFDVLVDSKNGVQILRELIRDLAIKGQLIEILGESNQDSLDSKDSLPSSWRWVKVEEVADFINGFAFRSDEYVSSGVGVVRMSDMKNGEIRQEAMKFVSAERLRSLDSNFQVKPNEIVMGMTGATLGKPCVNRTSEIFLLNQRIGKFVPKDIDPDYLFLALANLENTFMNLSFGTGVNNLSTKQIKDSRLPLPPRGMQREIVRVVGEMHKTCDKLEVSLNSKRNFASYARKSLINSISMAHTSDDLNLAWDQIQNNWDVVAGTSESISSLRQLLIDLAIQGQLLGQQPIGDNGFPNKWEVSDFASIGDIEGGNQPPKSVFSSEPRKDYIQLFQIRDLGSNPVPVFIPRELARSTSVEGEILIGRYGASVGKIFRAKSGAYNVALVKFIYPKVKLNSEFVYWTLKSSRSQALFTGMTRSAQAGFNKRDLAPLQIPMPSLDEQQKIVDRLNSLMAICDQLENLILKASDLGEKFAKSVVSNSA